MNVLLPGGKTAARGIELAGFGLCWWLSRYTGDVPCVCDKVLAEMFGDAAGMMDQLDHTAKGK